MWIKKYTMRNKEVMSQLHQESQNRKDRSMWKSSKVKQSKKTECKSLIEIWKIQKNKEGCIKMNEE